MLSLQRLRAIAHSSMTTMFKGLRNAREDRLTEVRGPDGLPFRFVDEAGMAPFIEAVLSGRDYPLLFAKTYRATQIVDVGAHMGAATRYFANSFPEAKVLSFEPNPKSFSLLEFNTAKLSNVELVQAGLGDRSGTAQLHMGMHSSMQASMLANQENTEDSVTIQVLDARMELANRGIEEISILKIDTEGLELPILKALEEVLPRTDFLYLEYHSEEDRLAIDAMLQDTFVLFFSSALEIDRGNVGYVRSAVLDGLRAVGEEPRYCFPKRVGGSEISPGDGRAG